MNNLPTCQKYSTFASVTLNRQSFNGKKQHHVYTRYLPLPFFFFGTGKFVFISIRALGLSWQPPKSSQEDRNTYKDPTSLISSSIFALYTKIQ